MDKVGLNYCTEEVFSCSTDLSQKSQMDQILKNYDYHEQTYVQIRMWNKKHII